MKKATLILAALFLVAGSIHDTQAQNRGGVPGGALQGRISGIVLDADTDEPIPSATVAVWNAADTSLATGAITLIDGSFLIEGIRPGQYHVKVSFIGYTTWTSDTFQVTPQTPFAELGTILLGSDATLLDEIQVTAERDFMEVHIDKTVYNTKDQLVSTGGSASDVLRNIPSVEVDIDGKVSLRGNQNVAVLINGRPSQMTGEMLASFLQGLPSSTIDRVEVMPNPSARYEPDGMSGILNIVLKKDVDRGLSGAVTAGTGTRDNANFSGMLGYGKGPLNAMVNYGFRYGTRSTFGSRYNEYRFGEAAEYLNVLNTGDRNSVSHNLNMNVDYRLSKYNSLTLNGMVGTRGQDGDDLNAFSELDAASILTNRYDRLTDLASDGLNTRAGLAFKRVVEPGKHEFTAEVDYGFRGQNNDQAYRQELVMPGTEALLTDLEQTARNEDNTNASAQVDYVRPLGKDGKLEAGAKSTLRRLDSDYYAETYDEATGAFVPEAGLNNAFVYDEQVHAAYASVGQQLGPLGVQLGLRAEQALTTFDLTTTGEAYDNSYFSLFPSAFLTYKFNLAHQVRASYSKRINRPRTGALNPFSDREDPLFRRQGNPYLKPEYTHSVELTYTLTAARTTLSLSPYFRRTVDVVRFIDSVDEAGVTTVTFKNLDKSDSWGAEAIATLRLGDRVNAFASFDAYRIATDGSSVESSLSNDALGWSTRVNASMKISPTLDVQASWFYRAPMDVEQGRIGSFSRSDIAIRQQLFGKKASLSMRVNDPFDTSGFSIERDTPTFYLQNTRRWDARSVNLTFTYNFGRVDNRNNRRNQDMGGDDQPAMGY